MGKFKDWLICLLGGHTEEEYDCLSRENKEANLRKFFLEEALHNAKSELEKAKAEQHPVYQLESKTFPVNTFRVDIAISDWQMKCGEEAARAMLRSAFRDKFVEEIWPCVAIQHTYDPVRMLQRYSLYVSVNDIREMSDKGLEVFWE